MIEICLFIKRENKGRRILKVAPREGETIVLDCGEMVRVIDVIHQWDDPDYIQVNAVPFSE